MKSRDHPMFDPGFRDEFGADHRSAPSGTAGTAGTGGTEHDGTRGRLVRLFALTGGRAQPSRDDAFTLITLITATQPPANAPSRSLEPELVRILRLCVEPIAVVELSARLDLPMSVIKIMLSDLLDAGMITARPPIRAVSGPNRFADIALLQRVRDGLARL